MPVAIITGGSRGLGRALGAEFVQRGFHIVIDGREAGPLAEAAGELRSLGDDVTVVDIAGDVTDPEHRARLIAAAQALGGLDVLINNASSLGPSPQPKLADYPQEALRNVFDVNVLGPLALIQGALAQLRVSRGAIINVTSDAGIEGYEGWGGYGSSKAALEQLSNVLATEERDLRVYWVDPGDMRTRMHQEAFPTEDISDRPDPSAIAPSFLQLLELRPPSGRYRAADVNMEIAGHPAPAGPDPELMAVAP